MGNLVEKFIEEKRYLRNLAEIHLVITDKPTFFSNK